MKLHLTAKSEQGKEITKSANEYIQINLRGEDRKIYGSIYIMPSLVYGSIYGEKFSMRPEYFCKECNKIIKSGDIDICDVPY